MTAPRITAAAIGWSSYQHWEGPRFAGRCPFVPPALPAWSDRLLAVISAHEGLLDSVNMYDRAVCSFGLVQWTELELLGVSSLLGAVAEVAPHALRELDDVMAASGVTFARRAPGAWRFRRGTMWVTSAEDLRRMYLGGATALKGTWLPPMRERARAWAAALANVMRHEDAQRAQVRFSAERVEAFGTPAAKVIVFDGHEPENVGLPGAVRAAFLSFAVNLPAVASAQVVAAHEASGADKWTLDWAIDLLRGLVFGAGVAFYPARYNAIRPVLERMFAVDLPDYAIEFRTAAADGLGSARDVQEALARLGFDPGPIDDRWGRLTAAALREYQRVRHLVPDGAPGPLTRARLSADLDALPPPAA